MCVKHIDRFRQNLIALAGLLPDLRLVAGKKASVMAKQSGPHGSRAVAPIPLNIGAFELLNAVTLYATNLAQACGLRYRHMGAESLLKGAAQHAPQLMDRKDALNCFKIADRSATRVRQQLTPPPDHINIGQCTTCSHDLWASEDDLTAQWMPCPHCGTTLHIPDIQQQRILKLAACSAQGTAADLSKLMKDCGINVERKTISKWKSRHVIRPVAEQNMKPVYLLWDVWQLVTRHA
jgi:predicted RNA-binding Zn-ribbon protein involved in translation (DUF1610 family)